MVVYGSYSGPSIFNWIELDYQYTGLDCGLIVSKISVET